MDLKLSQALAREFAGAFAGAVAADSLASKIRAASLGQREHKDVSSDVEQVLAEFLAGHGVGDELAIVDWEGKARPRGVLQQQSYSLLGTWTHPDLAVVAPFTVAFEFDREDDSWSGYKACLMKAACHALSGAYDAVVHVFTLKYADSSSSIYLQDDAGPTTFTGALPNTFTRQLMASLKAQGVVVAFVPPGEGAPMREPRSQNP